MSSFMRRLCKPIYTQVNILVIAKKSNLNQIRLLSVSRQQFFKSPTSIFAIQENISSLHLKKRPLRKKKPFEDDELKVPGLYNVLAYSTAEEYDLEALVKGLQKEDLYEPKAIDNNMDVVHAVAKYKLGNEPREIFFFREGSCVMWNMTDMESCNLLHFLKPYEQDSYTENFVQNEAEVMNYKHQIEGKTAGLSPLGDMLISPADNSLEKYTFSNAIALSVKLGIWESSLEKYIDSIEFITGDLKNGTRIKMTQEEALRKHGELFALRHVINLSSDLLDVPDFYWDRENLEVLYNSVCTYFSITKRTRVMNEKINHCVELIELLSSHLSDKHHCRLEWMIIVLIMVEVGFEIIHYVDRYLV
ncbi:PREDICTED: required for meiotic nuclear division protein 1 homolog [Nicrophorus vespilloides]|uniref:Required for meiotic nuclear division protein 1 homolog n=1 Tax=Nicrophorus vespilloides TaxID=110193 RepID=A0ABM1N3W0_NICVS|nr:PREDICTED: required for meiotic nuclear division protein 1 homolog [Nicrophorus vespilloides]